MKLPILKSSDVIKPSRGHFVLYINKDDKIFNIAINESQIKAEYQEWL